MYYITKAKSKTGTKFDVFSGAGISCMFLRYLVHYHALQCILYAQNHLRRITRVRYVSNSMTDRIAWLNG